MIKKLSPILLVTDINRSIQFYLDKLDFELDFRYEDFYAGIIKDGFSIHLKVSEHLTVERKSKENNEDPEVIFSVSGIEEIYQQLQKKSLELIQPLRDMPYGKEFYVADPDYNIIAFIEPR